MATTVLEAKLSRKVAELVLVIHTLFKKNQEHKGQLDAVVDLYEEELRKMSEFYEEKLKALEREMKMLREHNTKKEEKRQHETQTEMKTLIEQLESQARVASATISDLKEELSEKTEQLGAMRSSASEDKVIMHASEDSGNITMEEQVNMEEESVELLQKYKREILKLKNEKKNLSQKIVECHQIKSGEVEELRNRLETYEREKVAERSHHEAAVERGHEYLAQIKRLQKQKQTLTKRLRRCEENHRIFESGRNPTELPSLGQKIPKGQGLTRDEELEKLKEELEHYKMELVNREDNFNRLFVPKQRVIASDSSRVKGSWNLTGITKKGRKSSQLPYLSLTSEHVSNPHENTIFSPSK